MINSIDRYSGLKGGRDIHDGFLCLLRLDSYFLLLPNCHRAEAVGADADRFRHAPGI
jgi:hypothetical protein